LLHTKSVGISDLSHTKCHMPSCNGSLIIAIRQEGFRPIDFVWITRFAFYKKS